MKTDQRKSTARTDRPWLGVGILLCLTLFAWAPTLRHQSWSADDSEVVLASPVITGALPLSAAFTRDYTHHVGDSGQWRPTSSISLRVDHALHGPASSAGWHLSNLAIHMAAVALAALLAFRVRGELMMMGVALYAVHPLLADSVAWVSGRPSLICALSGLAGAHLLLWGLAGRAPVIRVGMFATIATLLPLLAKEDGLAFIPLLLLLSHEKGGRASRAAASGCLLGVSIWLFARDAALGEFLPTAAHPALAGVPLHERALVGFRAAAEATRLLWSPFDRPPHYEVAGLPGALSAALILSAATGLIWLARSRSRFPSAMIWIPVLAFAPFMQFIPSGEPFAPRFVHLPLLMSIPLADELLRRVRPRWGWGFIAMFALVAWRGAAVYESSESYWLAALRHSSQSPAAWNALGVARADEGRHEEAIESLRVSLEQDPGYSRAWSNLARSLHATGRAPEAIEALEAAKREGPNNPIAHINWALHLEREGDIEGARVSFLRAVRLRPGLPAGWDGLSRVSSRLGRTEEAAGAKERARSLRQP